MAEIADSSGLSGHLVVMRDGSKLKRGGVLTLTFKPGWVFNGAGSADEIARRIMDEYGGYFESVKKENR